MNTTILSSTSRGQVTLPKNWRDKFDTRFYKAEMKEGLITLTPLLEEKNDLESQIEASWQEYKQGKVISQKALIEKYGL